MSFNQSWTFGEEEDRRGRSEGGENDLESIEVEPCQEIYTGSRASFLYHVESQAHTALSYDRF